METLDPYKVNPADGTTIPMQKKSMNMYLKYGIIFLVCLLVVLGLGFLGYYYGTNQATNTTNNNESNNLTSSDIPNSTSDEDLAGDTTIKTYTYRTFSFKYSEPWTVFDSDTNAKFFTDNNLDIYKHGVIAQNDEYMIFFGIDTTENTSAEGIFLNESDEEKFKTERTKLMIEDKEFYLGNEHILISTLSNPEAETPLLTNVANLAEYVAKKVTNDQGTFNGYNEVIKRGDLAIFVTKIYSGTSSNVLTPEEIQNQIIEILQTISW